MIDVGDAFSLGTNYVLRTTGPACDAAVVRADVARAVALGLDVLRVHLDWAAFQPHADVVAPAPLAALAALCDRATASGIGIVPVLIGIRGGVPPWARGDFYAGSSCDAQVRYARAVAERIGAHAALRAWDIADDVATVHAPRVGQVAAGEHASEPVAERAIGAWSLRLAEALRAHSKAPVTIGAGARDLTTDRGVRFGSLYDALDFAAIGGATFELPFSRNARDPEAVPFLAMLTAGFSHRPVLLTDIGTPTCPAGKFSAYDRAPEFDDDALAIAADDPVFATYPCMTDDEQFAYARGLLARAHADGRLGALWSALYDDGDARGLLRADGTEKPVAAAFREAAAAGLRIVAADDLPSIAAPFYYRTLPSSMRTLYDAYLPFVASRRG